jgi:signal transduction histidine kinase
MTAIFRYQHKDGSWRWLECTGTNLLENPSVEALVINYRDISERRANEEALRQAHNDLERRVAERTSELSETNASLQRLSRRLVEVQEHERRSIARELHDEVGQILTGLKITLELIKNLPPEAIDEALDQAQRQVNELVARVRDISLDLRPAMLDDLGLLPALIWLIDRYSSQTKVRVSFKHSGIEGRYAPELETAIYRIVQEALTNVARHSRIGEATVMLWTTDEKIYAQIEDQGVGFKPESVLASVSSSGLTGMRERASLLDGKLTIESNEGAGTCVTAEMPLIRICKEDA